VYGASYPCHHQDRLRDRPFDVGATDTVLERGDTLRGDVAHARMYGQEGAPIIVVLGGISATRFVADGGRNNRGWWSTLVRDGGPIDLSKFQVLGLELLVWLGAVFSAVSCVLVWKLVIRKAGLNWRGNWR